MKMDDLRLPLCSSNCSCKEYNKMLRSLMNDEELIVFMCPPAQPIGVFDKCSKGIREP